VSISVLRVVRIATWARTATAQAAHRRALAQLPAAQGSPDRPPLLLETSLPGVFAAGDVRHRSPKRVATAVGEGAVAIQLVHEYLREH
jgi:NADPH-dependent glutamate synthase beta subunit-like oxidoreductase